MYFDLLVIIPLEEEFREFLPEFTLKANLTEGTRVKYHLEGPSGAQILAVLQEEMGYWAAGSACRDALDEHTFGLVVCLGIAGGLSGDVRLGDVCYSGTVIDTHDNGKIRDRADGGEDVDLASEFLNTPKLVYGPLGFVRVMPEFTELYAKWKSSAADRLEQLKAVNTAGMPTILEPETHAGDIVCGLVTESASYKKKLKQIQRKVLAVETESGAVFRACQERGVDAIAIRAVCDLADQNKGDLEEESKGIIRKYAASNASSFLRMQLENSYFAEHLSGKRAKPQLSLDIMEAVSDPGAALAAAQKAALAIAEEKLRALSPAYRTKSPGFQLPLPRMRFRGGGATSRKRLETPVEIRQAIKDHRRILISIPRVFPDRGLAWLIAQHLAYEVSGSKQFLPLVIEGHKVRPPRGTFDRLAPIEYESAVEQGAEVVFIINDFSASSSTNSSFLVEEIGHWPDARIIVLNTEETSIKEVEDLVGLIPAQHFSLQEVSFSEIAGFISQHYDMPCAQAEVVALRLRRIFQSFDLPAHPTYFAGIPQEMLAAVLDANRRAELIQLAVDGFLTFLVAEDKSRGRLSRTTRADFLKELAADLNFEKRSFNPPSLEDKANEFLTRYGFPTSPSDFLSGFFDRGILVVEAERVAFALPFMESYLLALWLHDNESAAVQYFDLKSDLFDLLTFDLFAEMYSSPQIVSAITSELDTLLPGNPDWEKEAVLLGNTIQPAVLRQKAQVSALKRRLELATDAVIAGVGEREEKQRLLDLADRVQDEVSDQRKENEETLGDNEAIRRLEYGLKIWHIAVVLFGQGSERLARGDKEKLSKLILEVGASLLDEWTGVVARIDFDAIREHLATEEMVSRFKGDRRLPSSLDLGEIIAGIIDIFEMSILTDPLRTMLDHLTEEARHDILVPFISCVEARGPLVRLIQATWLTDIDAAKGREKLGALLKALPHAAFLRLGTATHYLLRVYWSLSDKEARLALLSAASDLVRPLGRNVPVGEIKREIEKATRNDRS